MNYSLSPANLRVKEALEAKGFQFEIIVLDCSSRSSKEAAAAIGCKVEQIVKSLVFRSRSSGEPILVLASGANRVDEKVVGTLLGQEIEKADADFVRQHTGFAIGGVPPVGHLRATRTLIDCDLFRYEEIWAAAGTPSSVFRLSPDELLQVTEGLKISIK